MAPDDHATQVSLPSIHEMLPGWDLPGASELQWQRFAGDQRHLYIAKERIVSPDVKGYSPSLGRPGCHPRRGTQTVVPLVPSNHSPNILGPQGSHDLGLPAVSSPLHPHKVIYSFDVLKPHPVTSSLVNVASSTDIASIPVVPTIISRGYSPVSNGSPTELTAISVSKARPAFRVHLPPSSPSPSGYVIEGSNSPEHGRIKPYPRRSCLQFPPSLLPDPPPPDFGGPQHLFQPLPTIMQDAVDDKKHCCPHCEKRFNRPSSLNIHVNTHTGAKPFQCPYPGCSRRFNVNSNMRRHYRNHISARRRDSAASHMELDKGHQSYGTVYDPGPPYAMGTTLHKPYLSRSRSSSVSALDEEEDNGEQRDTPDNGMPIQGCNFMDNSLSPTNSPHQSGGTKPRFLPSVASCHQEDALHMLANVTECFHRTSPRRY